MIRTIMTIGALAILMPAPASAVAAKEKMETCKFGADDQKLKGAARKTFLKNCMAEEKPAAEATPVSGQKAPTKPKPASGQKLPADDSSGPRFPNVKE